MGILKTYYQSVETLNNHQSDAFFFARNHKVASDKQVEFINSLYDRKEGSSALFDDLPDHCMVDSEKASELIDKLLSLPDKSDDVRWFNWNQERLAKFFHKNGKALYDAVKVVCSNKYFTQQGKPINADQKKAVVALYKSMNGNK